MRKYTIIINHTGDNLYAVVLKSWLVDEEGTETDVQNVINTNISLDQAIEMQTKFLQ